MSTESTVLLVRPDLFPAGLEGQMTKRGAFVEVAELENAIATIPMVGPDLVVLAGTQELDAFLARLEDESVDVALCVVADWREHRVLRTKADGRIGALVPSDLPAIALAQRLVTLAQRAALGEPLQPSPSVRPPAEASKPAPKEASSVPEKEAPKPAGPSRSLDPKPSLAPKIIEKESVEAAAAPFIEKPAAHAPKAAEEKKAVEPVKVAPLAKPGLGSAKEEPKKRALAAAETVPAKAAEASAGGGAETVKPHKAISIAPAASVEKTSPAPSGAGKQTAIQGTQQELTQSASLGGSSAGVKAPPDVAKPAVAPKKGVAKQTIIGLGPEELGLDLLGRNDAISPPKEAPPSEDPELTPVPDSLAEETLTSESRPRAPEEQTERIPLTASQRLLPPVRLGVVDRNLTRAGAIVEALTARGLRAQLVGVDEDQTRWRLFRRFAPQGVVIDEASLEEATGWLDALRLDPFLGHVPLVPIRYESLFHQEVGKVDLGHLIPLVTSLGNEERAIGDILSLKREIEFRLHQVGVYSLLTALAERTDVVQITGQEDGIRLEFAVARGRLHQGTLVLPEKPKEEVSAEGILEWLLAHPQVRLILKVVTTSPKGESRPIEPMLIDSTTEEAVPVAPRRPTARSLRPRPLSLAPPFEESGPSSRRAAASTPRAQAETLPAPTSTRTPKPAFREKLRSIVEDSRPRLDGVLAKLRSVPRKAWVGVGGGVLVASLASVFLLSRGKEVPSAPPPPKPVVSAPAPPAPKAKSETEASYFVVGPELTVATCESLAGPSNEPASSAPIYLKQGRKALVAGDLDKALGLLCRSAILDSSPVPAESVSQLYLARRSHSQAERWAKVALEREPGRRTVLELLADIEVDRGNVEAALFRLLESMRLTETDMLKRAAVSRNLIKEARVVEKAGDRSRAGRLLRRAYLLDPKASEPSVRLSVYFNSLSEFGLSERWARRAIELSGDSSEARVLLGEFALTAGDRVMAADHFSKVGVAEKYYDRAQEKLRQLK